MCVQCAVYASVHIVGFHFPALLFLSLVPLLLASHLEIHVEVKPHQRLDAAVFPDLGFVIVFTALSYFSSKW